MSELSVYQPAISTQACIRSFALASEAPKISRKEEVLILSRLMSAALGYNSTFWNYLKADNTAPMREFGMMARRAKRAAFLERQDVPENDHADFVSESDFLFEQLHYYAEKFDARRGTDSGLTSLIEIAPAFIRAQENAQKKSLENGLPAVRYVNPYVTVNVASVVMFDIFKDIEYAQPHRTPHDLQESIAPLYTYVDQIRKEYPVHLSPHVGAVAYKNDQVRNCIFGTYDSLEDHARFMPDIDVDTARGVNHGLKCVQTYLSAYVQNIREDKQNFEARILTFSEWGPLVEAAREKRAEREERRKSHPELVLPKNDF